MAKTKLKETEPESKQCPVCERPFQNRKKWQSRGLWEAVKYCSERCRRSTSKNQH
ncbi:DUF2256 domain-containing protein [Granulosicoccus sp.]|nr:DUF2256 domain-containing protein [Granulosicoccus sp.]MDB4222514.1 DUF2256 domain-containing protein [Granulosicoccus sp.]